MERMTREQIKAAGGIAIEQGPGPAAPVQKMSRADIEAAGGKPVSPPGRVSEELTEPGGLSHGPGTAGAANALDALSGFGVPTVLAMQDAVSGVDSEATGRAGSPVKSDAPDFRTRYYKNKAFYEGGMKRLGDTNPKAAIAGQFAPMALPTGALLKGAKLGSVLKFGAGTGAAAGLLRGPAHTLGGDVAGTAADTTLGAGVGAVAAGLGSGAGKLLEKGGDIASRAMGRFMGRVKAGAMSEKAGFAKVQQMGQGARRNLPEDLAAANATVIGKSPAVRAPQLDDRRLAQRAVGYNEKAKADAIRNLNRYGDRAAPPTRELLKKHLGIEKGKAGGLISSAVKAGALGLAGYKGAEAAGVDPRIGAAIGGAGGLYALRKLSQAVAAHPATLKKLMALRPIGQAMAKMGAKGAATPKNVAAVVYALRGEPEVQRVLREFEAGSD